MSCDTIHMQFVLSSYLTEIPDLSQTYDISKEGMTKVSAEFVKILR